MPFNPLSLVSGPNMGSINMPKLLRTLKFRTNNVRKLIFHRDAMFERDVGTVKDANADGSGRTDVLAGPPVSFGYETSDNTTRVAAADRAYHTRVDEINVMGLEALIMPSSPQTSTISRAGNQYGGLCDIYLPTVRQILAQSNDDYMSDDPLIGGSEFAYTIENGFNKAGGHSYFDRFESRDEFIDMERIVYNPENKLAQTSGDLTYTLSYEADGSTATYYTSGMTRLQFKLKATTTTRPSLAYVQILGSDSTGGNDSVSLKWTFSTTLNVPAGNDEGASRHEILTVDLPLIHSNGKNIKTGDTYKFQTRSSAITATAAVVDGAYNSDNEFALDKLIGDSNFDGQNQIKKLKFNFGGGTVGAYDLTDIVFYESSDWVIDGITEYRDEYLKLSCGKRRGSSPSRRRAYG
jgi:hypothetical protein